MYTFESYLVQTSATMQHKSVSINELIDTFLSLKFRKSPGYDKISFNVVKKCFRITELLNAYFSE